MVTLRDSAERARRLYGPTLLAGLLGALGVTVGVSRSWATATSSVHGLPTMHASVAGSDLAPLAGALGVVMLAAFGAVIATRGWLRRGLGIAIVVASCVVVVTALHPGGATDALTSGLSARGWDGEAYQTSTTVWRWLVLAGATLSAAAGVVIARFGGVWAVMGARYDAPVARSRMPDKPAEELSETEVWQALDVGRDPTDDAR